MSTTSSNQHEAKTKEVRTVNQGSDLNPIVWDWHKIDGQRINTTPALVEFKGSLYMVYKADVSSDIYITHSNDRGATWVGVQRVGTQTTSAGPSVAVFQDHLYIVYKSSTDNQIWVTRTENGDQWTDSHVIQGTRSVDMPAATVFKDSLYVFHKAEDNRLKVSFSSTAVSESQWTTLNIGSQITGAGPAVAVMKDTLYVAYKGFESESLLITSSATGSKWNDDGYIIPDQTTVAPPALTFLNDSLYLVYTKNAPINGQLFVTRSLNGTDFVDTQEVSSQQSSAGPAMTTHWGNLYVAYKDNFNNDIWITRSPGVVKRLDGARVVEIIKQSKLGRIDANNVFLNRSIKFQAVSAATVRALWNQSGLGEYQWRTSKDQTSDFAASLKGEVFKWICQQQKGQPIEDSVAAAFGIIYAQKSNIHLALNFFIDFSDNFILIDPSTGGEFNPDWLSEWQLKFAFV